MYTIMVDGQLLYRPDDMDTVHVVAAPKLTMQVNQPGSLTFTVPPTNTAYTAAKKMKSVVTVEQDGVELWRGRIISDERDLYNQRKVVCEGNLAYLYDSIQRPYDLGDQTVVQYLSQMITNHNTQVDDDKKFVLGVVEVTDTWHAGNVGYSDTYTEIKNNVVDILGGYMMTRKFDGGYAIDYLLNGRANAQRIEFGKNLLNLQEYINGSDIFTVLIPTGATDDGDVLTISDVNDGLDYIQDDAAVALFGKIWKAQSWNDITDANALKAKAQTYLAEGVTAATTMTITAVDLHLLDVNTEKIRVGDSLWVVSAPHGISKQMVCTQIGLDMSDPGKSVYTFGTPEKSLSERQKFTAKQSTSTASKVGSSGGGLARWKIFKVSDANKTISGTAEQTYFDGQVNLQVLRAESGEVIGTMKAKDIVASDSVEAVDVKVNGELSIRVQGYKNFPVKTKNVTIDGKSYTLLGLDVT